MQQKIAPRTILGKRIPCDRKTPSHQTLYDRGRRVWLRDYFSSPTMFESMTGPEMPRALVTPFPQSCYSLYLYSILCS
jgi:hypothetical protein